MSLRLAWSGLLSLFALFLPLSPAIAQDPQVLKATYQQMIQAFPNDLAEAQRSGLRYREIDLLNNVATAYQYLGDYQNARKLQQQALEIARQIKDRGREAGVIFQLATTEMKLGDDGALKFYRQQVALTQNDPESQFLVLKNLGYAHMSRGEYAQVLEIFEQLLPVTRTLKQPNEEIQALLTIAGTYGTLGKRVEAIQRYQEAIALARFLGQTQSLVVGLISLGKTYEAAGDFSKALPTYEEALQSSQKAGSQDTGVIVQTIAQLYTRQNDLPKAIALLEQGLQQTPDLPNHLNRAIFQDYLSRAYALAGNYPKAITLQEQSLATYQKINQTSGALDYYPKAQANLGELLLRAGRFSESEQLLRAAIQTHAVHRQQYLANSRIISVGTDVLNILVRESLVNIYRNLQEVLVAQKQFDRALEVSEEGRGRAFVDLLNPKLLEDPKVQASLKAPNLSQMQQIAKTQNSTLVQYTLLYNDSKYQPLYLGDTKPQETKLLIWVIKPSGEITFREQEISKVQQKVVPLETLVAEARRSLRTGNRGFTFNEDPTLTREVATRLSTSGINPDLQALHQLLIQPIADLLPQDPNARVTFIPQDFLFLVPFAALQDGKGDYLIKQHTILVAPSIQTLELTRKPQSAGGSDRVLVVGNPVMPKIQLKPWEPAIQLSSLPGAESEAKEIATLFQTQAVLGNQATETEVLKQMPSAKIIHLATHGLLDNFTGFQSSLALTPSGSDNGFLTVNEIIQTLKLSADLVVLSACDTGRGRISGEGVVGLSRAFLAAGASSVVVSLWKVPDTPTAALMTQFYRNLQKNPDKAQALRQAMLTTMQQYPDPVDWAAFILTGQAD